MPSIGRMALLAIPVKITCRTRTFPFRIFVYSLENFFTIDVLLREILITSSDWLFIFAHENSKMRTNQSQHYRDLCSVTSSAWKSRCNARQITCSTFVYHTRFVGYRHGIILRYLGKAQKEVLNYFAIEGNLKIVVY